MHTFCIYKFHGKKAADYVDETFSYAECNGIPSRYSYQKLSSFIAKQIKV